MKLNHLNNENLEKNMRPVVYDYKSPVDFLNAIFLFNKNNKKHYSIRRIASTLQGCSPSLVSQVLSGKRRLTRDQLSSFAKIFKLNELEVQYLDEQMNGRIRSLSFLEEKKGKIPSNHILKDWLHVYVKDTCELRNFKPDVKTVHRLLGGMVSLKRIERSMEFLIKEGFWRRTKDNKLVINEDFIETTDEIPDKKISQFHKQALELAKKGIDKFPVERRYAGTYLLSVDKSSEEELRLLIKKFHKEVRDFVDSHPGGNEQLVQINLNMTPIGGVSDD